MGLSIAIMGGVVSLALITILASLQGSFTDGTYERAVTTIEAQKLSDSLSKIDFEIESIEAASSNDLLNFTLRNTGAGKLWDYENFDVIIEYDANIRGNETPTVERLAYESSSSFLTLPAIEVDNVSRFHGTCGVGIEICTFSHTVGTADRSDRILIVGISPEGSASITGVWYNSLPLTEIRTDDDGGSTRSSLWYLVDPPVGTFTVEVSLSSTVNVVIGAISFVNVNQADPIGIDNGNTGTNDNPTVDLVTTVDDSWIVDVVGTLNGPMTPNAKQTERWDQVSGTFRGAGSTQVTKYFESHTMSWTNTAGNNPWSISAAEIKPLDRGTCVTNGSFSNKDWIIYKISDDVLDPNVINNNEVAQICTNLSYGIFAGGDVKITVTTDLGVTRSKSITLP